MTNPNPVIRTFDDRPAVREKTPVLVGLVGPSGGGKTYSALRLATGMQRVTGGDIYAIDTEARRMLHYAEIFKFRHVPFGNPFGSLDYLQAIEHCLRKGAKNILIDSMSHEHEGPGGVLEMHDAETKRLAALWKVSEDVAKMSAWQKPKAERRRLINSMLQMECNIILCFRSKQKLKIVKGKQPEQRGWQPIAGEEFIYEMTLKALLLPGANGVPTWNPEHDDEKAMVKLPGQFRQLFAGDKPVQITEDIGQQLATWGAGAAAAEVLTADQLVERYAACSDPATFRALGESGRASWSKYQKPEKDRVNKALAEAKERVEKAARFQETESKGKPDPDGDLNVDRGAAGDDDRAAAADAEPGAAAG